MDVVVGAGLESISLTQNDHRNTFRSQDPDLVERVPAIYMSMLETAEVVAERYGVTREAQDEYALQSHSARRSPRTRAASRRRSCRSRRR